VTECLLSIGDNPVPVRHGNGTRFAMFQIRYMTTAQNTASAALGAKEARDHLGERRKRHVMVRHPKDQ
jgi:hypothetical protein